MYTNNIAKVLINNRYSGEFKIKSGVLQCSILGPTLYIIFINDLLESLNASCLGAKIGNIIISALGFADDIILTSDSPEKEQKLIVICETWSKINYMLFKISKCNAMALNRIPAGLVFKLDGSKLKIVKSHKYIGITMSTKKLANYILSILT